MSASGYLSDVNNDYSKYVGTDAYKVVNTPEELVEALLLARLDYETKVTEHDEGYIVRNNVRKNETNWKNAIAKGLYLKKVMEHIQKFLMILRFQMKAIQQLWYIMKIHL